MSSNYRNRSPDGKSRQEKLKEITDQLEAGVSEVFTSDENFKAFLECCSRFHSYSVSNCILILSQCPEASYVAGYVDWNRKFGRHVKKGAKGIKILAPYKYKVEVTDDDLNNRDSSFYGKADASDHDAGGKKTIERIGFKVVTVFDYSMTEGKVLPSIGINDLTGDVTDYRRVFNDLVSISPVPVFFEEIEGGAKGYYSDSDKRIAINKGMSEAQTIKTLLHELSYANL